MYVIKDLQLKFGGPLFWSPCVHHPREIQQDPDDDSSYPLMVLWSYVKYVCMFMYTIHTTYVHWDTILDTYGIR